MGFSGIEADHVQLQAIADLPPPQNFQEVKTFFDMVNKLGKFFQHLTDMAQW